MNKYEALGRITVAKNELSNARKARTILAEQIYHKSQMLRLRPNNTDEITHFNNAIEEVEVLLSTCKEKHQEVVEQLEYIDELKVFC